MVGRLRLRRGRWWLTLLGLLPATFYAFTARQYVMSEGGWMEWLKSVAIFAGIVLLFNILGRMLCRIPWLGKRVTIPADLIIMRLAEVFNSIPGLIFIFVMAALLPKENQSMWVMIALIGVISWTGAARFIRADLLRVRELDYVTAARGLGFSEARILLRHALPNALGPIVNAIALSLSYLVGGVIIVETIFNYPGIAKLMVDAVATRDLPLIQTCAMIFCIGYLLLTTLADIVAIAANPKLR